jgi:hypothetical protein
VTGILSGDTIFPMNTGVLKSEDSTEGDSMKLMCVILSFAILFAGCYTHTTVTKDSPLPPPTVKVCFRLTDGTDIFSNEYRRVENGYRVVGKLLNKENKNSKNFSGIVSDEQIKEVVTNEFSPVKTVGVVLGIGVVVGLWYAYALGIQ